MTPSDGKTTVDRTTAPTAPARPTLTRRSALAAAGAAALAGALPATAHAAPAEAAGRASRGGPEGRGSSPRASEQRAYAFLRVMTDAYPEANGDGPRLAQSYSDENGLFSTAFVYDNALAICAALTGGREDLALAATLGDGLLHALDHDPTYDDGRLRQAYNVGPYTFYDGSRNDSGFVLPDGTANVGYQFGFLGTAVGDMAWPGIALVQLAERTGERRYLDGALRIAGWIVANTRSEAGLGGFSFGVDAADQPVPNKSTEHNIDCTSFFTQLAAATHDRRWLEQAAHARAFVERVWEPAGGYFYTGSNDGATINRDPLPLDPQTWSWLALRDRRYAGALDWAEANLAATDVAGQGNSQLPAGVTISGVTFSSASLTSTASYNGVQVHQQGVWLEGTGQLVTALADRRRGGDVREAKRLLEQVRTAQALVGQGQHVGGQPLPERSGVVAASSLLDTGFGFGYLQTQHVGATAWYLMGARRANPLQRGGLR